MLGGLTFAANLLTLIVQLSTDSVMRSASSVPQLQLQMRSGREIISRKFNRFCGACCSRSIVLGRQPQRPHVEPIGARYA